jgi:hypothetical protein
VRPGLPGVEKKGKARSTPRRTMNLLSLHPHDAHDDAWSPSVVDRLPAALPAKDPLQELMAEVQRDRLRLLQALAGSLAALLGTLAVVWLAA